MTSKQKSTQRQISLDEWLTTPLGELASHWMLEKADDLVVNVFGYTALQLGLQSCDLLRSNRIRTKVILTQDDLANIDAKDIVTDEAKKPEQDSDLPYQKELEQLYHNDHDIPQPFAKEQLLTSQYLNYDDESVDLVVLPFTLDWHHNPHHILREVDRVLAHEGRIIIYGFNPYSLWGLRNKLSRYPYLPIPNSKQISLQKTKDWLQLLSFEIDRGQLACYEPACMNKKRLEQFAFMNKAGNRWWPFAGAIFYLSAIKRHINPSLVGPVIHKKQKKSSLRPAAVATKNNIE
ncbi:MAG: class I SAM-dependent methyltransferase [Alcaligenaceae bacterium]|nr:class I SAM-dependent methyltransferase [Alcaligenaceae bacterium]